MAAVKAMYVRFSKGNFWKRDALSALKCGFFTFTFDVICPKNSSFWGGQLPFKIMEIWVSGVHEKNQMDTANRII